MKTITLQLYTFDELSDEVQKEIIERERWNIMEQCMEGYGSDYVTSLRAFEKLTNTQSYSWSVNYSGYDFNFKCSYNPIFECPVNCDNDIYAEDLCGKLLFRYINNNIMPYITHGQYIIQNSQYEGDLGVELCASLDEFLSNVEHLYTRYKHSIPSTMSECKSRKYFKALSDKDLEDEDMLFGVGRDIAQVELELYILCQIILGIGWDANKMGKWFWQSNKDRDLVILKNWVTVEK